MAAPVSGQRTRVTYTLCAWDMAVGCNTVFKVTELIEQRVCLRFLSFSGVHRSSACCVSVWVHSNGGKSYCADLVGILAGGPYPDKVTIAHLESGTPTAVEQQQNKHGHKSRSITEAKSAD